MIPRPAYLGLLNRFRNLGQIKVLTGVRRCGKSTVLQLFADQLLAEGVPPENIIQRRFDDFNMPLGFTGEDLRQELAARFEQAQEGTVYVFLDEIQDVPEWERVVRRLHTRDNTDVYITGSNAGLLSGELATYLAGRYVEIPVYPLSFAEYYAFRAALAAGDGVPVPSAEQALNDYMVYGGMPGLYARGDAIPTEWRATLSAVYDSVVVRDVASRYAVRDMESLQNLAEYMFSTSGNFLNPTRISGLLKAKGLALNPRTVSNWMEGLRSAFILYSARTEHLRGSKTLSPLRKWYTVDNGFRNLVCSDPQSDLGPQLESLVFIELKRRGFEVTVGRIDDLEIDFIAKRGLEREYYQVTWSMADEAVRQRELEPLRRLSDSFPRTVITMNWLDVGQGITAEGIRIIHATDWLLGAQ